MNLQRSKKTLGCSDPVWETVRAYDEVAEDYCRRTLTMGDREFQEKMIDRTLDMLPEEPCVLDIGCGDGRDTDHMYERGAEVVGMDLSAEMVKLARKTYPSLDFLRMDMREMGFREKYFDCIWASASVIHIPRKGLKSFEEEVLRSLKPDGIFAFSFKVGHGEGFEYGETMKEKKRYVVYHTPKSIQSFFGKLRMIDLVEYPGTILGSPFAYCWMKNIAEKL